MIVSRTLLLGV